MVIGGDDIAAYRNAYNNCSRFFIVLFCVNAKISKTSGPNKGENTLNEEKHAFCNARHTILKQKKAEQLFGLNDK